METHGKQEAALATCSIQTNATKKNIITRQNTPPTFGEAEEAHFMARSECDNESGNVTNLPTLPKVVSTLGPRMSTENRSCTQRRRGLKRTLKEEHTRTVS